MFQGFKIATPYGGTRKLRLTQPPVCCVPYIVFANEWKMDFSSLTIQAHGIGKTQYHTIFTTNYIILPICTTLCHPIQNYYLFPIIMAIAHKINRILLFTKWKSISLFVNLPICIFIIYYKSIRYHNT